MNERLHDMMQDICFKLDAFAIDLHDASRNNIIAGAVGVKKKQAEIAAPQVEAISAMLKGVMFNLESEVETRIHEE